MPWIYLIEDFNGEETVGTFPECFERELDKTNQKEFKTEKVTNKKVYKLYVKWKSYDNSFNSWIDKRDFVI